MKRAWIQLVAAFPLGEITVVILNGEARKRRGNPRVALLSELTELAKENGFPDACIHAAQKKGLGVKLKIFGIPPAFHQRVRNVWGANSL